VISVPNGWQALKTSPAGWYLVKEISARLAANILDLPSEIRRRLHWCDAAIFFAIARLSQDVARRLS
jgi:hypothetical protein